MGHVSTPKSPWFLFLLLCRVQALQLAAASLSLLISSLVPSLDLALSPPDCSSIPLWEVSFSLSSSACASGALNIPTACVHGRVYPGLTPPRMPLPCSPRSPARFAASRPLVNYCLDSTCYNLQAGWARIVMEDFLEEVASWRTFWLGREELGSVHCLSANW